MPKTKKLLCLLATAAAATATGCAGARTTAPRAPVATAVVLGAAVEAPAEAPAPVDTDTVTPLAAGIVADEPLVGASGRPACGNVQTKSQNSMKNCDNLASR